MTNREHLPVVHTGNLTTIRVDLRGVYHHYAQTPLKPQQLVYTIRVCRKPHRAQTGAR